MPWGAVIPVTVDNALVLWAMGPPAGVQCSLVAILASKSAKSSFIISFLLH